MQNLLLYHKNILLPPDLIKFIKSEVKQKKYRSGALGLHHFSTYPNYDVCQPLYGFYDKIIKQALFRLTISYASFKQFIWAQIYLGSWEWEKDAHEKHNHHSETIQLSWVHFIKTPDKKCFRFTTTFVPPNQGDGDFILFPSWAVHEVLPHYEKTDRIAVVGNVSLWNLNYK